LANHRNKWAIRLLLVINVSAKVGQSFRLILGFGNLTICPGEKTFSLRSLFLNAGRLSAKGQQHAFGL